MGFYDLEKSQRAGLVAVIRSNLEQAFGAGRKEAVGAYFSDADTYIRKAAYLSAGRIYKEQPPAAQQRMIRLLKELINDERPPVRQTVVNAAGEIGKADFAIVEEFFSTGLFDSNPSVRNAVIGSVKKMGEVNPGPVLGWARAYLHHPDKEVRREICHGIELRGRKYPGDILPLLRTLEWDKTARVRNTLVHVLGQIAYKKGCLECVVEDLKQWENQELVQKALGEIISVHYRYRNFAVYTREEAREYIRAQFQPAVSLREG